MDDYTTEAGVARETASASTVRDNHIVSDILQPRYNNTSPGEALPELLKHQALLKERKAQEHTATISMSPLPSSSQLAVHIRSSASPSQAQQRKRAAKEDDEVYPKQTIVGKEIAITLPVMQDGTEEPSIQPKKRGRPKGWRPGMSYVNAKGDAEGLPVRSSEPRGSTDQPREPKRRGRPPRAAAASLRERYLQSNPDYTPFLCEWKFPSETTCPAELQNMKTLRKHVYVVHGDANPLVCRWGKCAAKDTPIQFAERAEFEEHMNKVHFRSYVWHMGEGYQNEGISTPESNSDKLPAYLFDKNGNQVTPSITGQEFEDERQQKERMRKLKRLLIQQAENAPSQEEWTRQTLGIK